MTQLTQTTLNEYYEQKDDDIDSLVDQLYESNISDATNLTLVIQNYIKLHTSPEDVEFIRNIQVTHSRWVQIFSSWNYDEIISEDLEIIRLFTESIKFVHNPPEYDAIPSIKNVLGSIIQMQGFDINDIDSLNHYLCENV